MSFFCVFLFDKTAYKTQISSATFKIKKYLTKNGYV